MSAPGTIAAVTQRLGLTHIAPNHEGLRELYTAWCRSIPFDSARKRLFQAAGALGTVPGWRPGEFFQDWLDHGTGGSCWSTSLALCELAAACGFDARLAAGTMLTDPDVSPNHGTVLVELDDATYMIDSSMLFEEPLALADKPTNNPSLLHPVHAEPSTNGWTVTWRPAHSNDRIACAIDPTPVEIDAWDRWHDATRGYSLFNAALYIRRNNRHGIEAYGRGKIIVRSSDGTLAKQRVPAHEVPELLVARFGLSREVVAALPPDEEGPAFL